MSYQDRWRKGQQIGQGYRACEERYQLIRRFVAPLGIGFTVLDVGAAEGYFSIRLSEEFQARVTAVEPRHVSYKAVHPNIRWVHQPFTDSLGRYDVVLALSLLHHVVGWREMLTLLIESASQLLIIETPHPDEKLRAAKARHELANIDHAIQLRGGVRIGNAPGVWNKELSRGLYAITKS